jgi:hypothetical protein
MREKNAQEKGKINCFPKYDNTVLDVRMRNEFKVTREIKKENLACLLKIYRKFMNALS